MYNIVNQSFTKDIKILLTLLQLESWFLTKVFMYLIEQKYAIQQNAKWY